MARGRTVRALLGRWDGQVLARHPDELIVEEPLEIRLDGHLVGTTMRTPGHDFELAAGVCHSDGLLGGARIESCRYCATGSAVDTEFNVVTVDTGGHAPVPMPRLSATSSACGLCGSTALDALRSRIGPISTGKAWSTELLTRVPATVRRQQPLFDLTGAVHAAAAFDRSGQVLVVREDIGRHNAVDKVVGRLLLDGALPATDLGLYVSGRAAFEIVQKVWAAGFSAVVAVSAPSSLAVEAARLAGITLAGFVRSPEGDVVTCNIYSPELSG